MTNPTPRRLRSLKPTPQPRSRSCAPRLARQQTQLGRCRPSGPAYAADWRDSAVLRADRPRAAPRRPRDADAVPRGSRLPRDRRPQPGSEDSPRSPSITSPPGVRARRPSGDSQVQARRSRPTPALRCRPARCRGAAARVCCRSGRRSVIAPRFVPSSAFAKRPATTRRVLRRGFDACADATAKGKERPPNAWVRRRCALRVRARAWCRRPLHYSCRHSTGKGLRSTYFGPNRTIA